MPEKKDVTRVVLADDHDVVRQGLKRLLNRAPEIEVVGEASDGMEAIHFVRKLKPDVLLLDIEMPVMDGIEVARRLRADGIGVRILVLSAYDDREYIRALLDIGVSGYLVKGEAPGKIVEAVRGVAKGQRGWVSPQVRKKVEKMQEASNKQNTLTYRDLQMLRALAENKSMQDIAQEMELSLEMIEQELAALLCRMDVDSPAKAVEIAIVEGWLTGLS